MTAPIALFVYKRPAHTRKTLEALKKNALAKDSHLIVFSDGARNDADIAGVEEVRKLFDSLDGFHSVTVHKRPANYGLAKSIIEGVSEVCAQYGRVIVLEDDLVTSPVFLEYMNDGLNNYSDNNDVISIHGYVYPTERALPETFFLRGADCWGWATWKRGWDLFDADARKHLDALHSRKLDREFNFDNHTDYTGMLRDHIAGKINSWAICWYASAFLANKLTLYPGVSLVQNIGNDDSGTHSHDTERFHGALRVEPMALGGIVVEQSAVGYAAFSAFFRAGKRSLASRLKSRAMRMLKAWG